MRPIKSFGIGNLADLPQIPVFEIPYDEGHQLVRNEPIRLDVRKSESGQYLTIDSEDLDASLSEESLKDLEDTFNSVLVLAWDVFAMGDPNEMDKRALEIRDRLRATYRLVPVIIQCDYSAVKVTVVSGVPYC